MIPAKRHEGGGKAASPAERGKRKKRMRSEHKSLGQRHTDTVDFFFFLPASALLQLANTLAASHSVSPSQPHAHTHRGLQPSQCLQCIEEGWRREGPAVSEHEKRARLCLCVTLIRVMKLIPPSQGNELHDKRAPLSKNSFSRPPFSSKTLTL